MGSIILDEKLQDITKRQVLEYFSIVLLKAACAAPVRASASSRNIILNPFSPKGAVRANSFIFPLTTSIPLSSEAFNSCKLCFHNSPNISLARAKALVVLPMPAGPAKSK